MGKWNLETARASLERNEINVQGTAIFTNEKRPMGLKLLGAVDYLCGEMGFRVNPPDIKEFKKNKKKREDS
jgi:hypothetical protein